MQSQVTALRRMITQKEPAALLSRLVHGRVIRARSMAALQGAVDRLTVGTGGVLVMQFIGDQVEIDWLAEPAMGTAALASLMACLPRQREQ